MGTTVTSGPRALTLAATALGSSLAFVDATIVVVALPAIDEALGLGLAGLQWVVVAYSLALAALYLVAGAVGDAIGHRRSFVAGVAVFAAASLAAGLAPDSATLVGARAVQGVGGAFMTTSSLALLRETYAEQAGRAIGAWTALTGVATVAGPPLGGAFVEWASWRWVFFVNLPLALVTVVLAGAGRSGPAAPRPRARLDLRGAALAAAAVVLLAHSLVAGGQGDSEPRWWELGAAACLLAAFVAVERRSPAPLVPGRLLLLPGVAGANAATFLVYGALGGASFLLAPYLQLIGFDAFAAGLALVPVSLLLIVLAAPAGRLADRRGPRPLVVAGASVLGCGLVLLAFVSDRETFWRAGIAGLILFGVGLAGVVAPITTASLMAVEPTEAGLAAGLNQTVARLGNLLAVACVGIVLAAVFEHGGGLAGTTPLTPGARPRGAATDAYRAAMLFAAGLAFAGAAAAAVGIGAASPRSGAPRAGGQPR